MSNPPQLNNQFNSGGQPIPPSLTKGRKLAVFALAVFAFFIIILWLVQFKKNISQPFAYNGDSSQADVSGGQAADDLKNKDTDRDGLSDYDEANIYGTSAYLPDSDSDGISDGEEVKKGANPNCPEGRVCNGANSASGDQNIINPGTASDTAPSTQAPANELAPNNQNQLQLNASSSVSNSQLQSVLNSNIDAAGLRQILLQAGMQKDVLDKINDADLMKSYQETLGSQ